MHLADIPLDQIAIDALHRDRGAPDPAAQDDLVRSIRAIGLRHPVEVFATGAGPQTYGLISGHRRLLACRELGHATIAALLCTPADIPAAMAAMVAENEVRLQVSPWDKGRLLLKVLDNHLFPDEDAALDALHPSATRQQRYRLRGFMEVALCLPGLSEPERISTRDMDRLASALRCGGEELLASTLKAAPVSHGLQWLALRPVLDSILTEAEPATGPGRKRRASLVLPQGLTLTKQRDRHGWFIRFSGEHAKSPGLVDDVFEIVWHWLGK